MIFSIYKSDGMNSVYLHILFSTATSIAQEVKVTNQRELNLDGYRTELVVRAADLKKVLGAGGDAGKMERSLRLLRQVEYALWRLERGRYGECVKCEGRVEPQVLDAMPWAIFCGNCQGMVDILQAEAEARRSATRQAA
jgi:RNA polymerase-binding transcription factor DksA